MTYETPERRLLVSDGVTAWSYDRSKQTVFTTPAEESIMAPIALLLTGEMADQPMTVTFLGGSTDPDRGLAALEIIPGDENRWIRSIVLTLTPDCPCIKRILVVDHTGCATRITFDRIETNVGLGERHFRFIPPKNARVITP
jgi:outer membrane lipoprotein-sorting protein